MKLQDGTKPNFPKIGFGVSSKVWQGDFDLVFGYHIELDRSVSLNVIMKIFFLIICWIIIINKLIISCFTN